MLPLPGALLSFVSLVYGWQWLALMPLPEGLAVCSRVSCPGDVTHLVRNVQAGLLEKGRLVHLSSSPRAGQGDFVDTFGWTSCRQCCPSP